MVAVLGFLIAWVFVTAVLWWQAGLTREPDPDPSFDPADAAGRTVSTVGGLAGFAVTGVVLLVSQTSNLATLGRDYTNVLTMFVVAYMGLLAAAFQLASISDKVRAPFDLAAAQFATGVVGLYFIFIGWFALRPLFLAFGLAGVADITSWLIAAVNLFGYPLLGASLVRSGYASVKTMLLAPMLAILATIGYVLGVWLVVPGGHVSDGVLILTLVAFVPGAVMYGVGSFLPLAARRERIAAVLARRWHLVLLGYVAAVTILVEFLLVSVLDIA